jgi:hypothetical protein
LQKKNVNMEFIKPDKNGYIWAFNTIFSQIVVELREMCNG